MQLLRFIFIFLGLALSLTTSADSQPEKPPEKARPTMTLGSPVSGVVGKIQRHLVKNIRGAQRVFMGLSRPDAIRVLKDLLTYNGYPNFVDHSPRLAAYIVDVLQHPTALEDLVWEVGKWDRFKLYLIFFGGLVVIIFILKRMNRRRNIHWMRRCLVGICFYFAFMVGNILSFYLVFYPEINPLITLAMTG